jgi:hypothetical protein
VSSLAVAASPGNDLLQKGRDEYHNGKYAEAANDLRAAADAFITPDQLAAYVNSGHLEALPQFETALVYLTLSYAKLGREAEARDALRRLHVAEQIEPTYQQVPLDADAADFENVMQKLTPDMPLPANQALADLRNGVTRPTQVAQQTTPPQPMQAVPATSQPTQVAQATPQPTQVAQATPAPAPAPEVAPQPKLPVEPTIAAQREAMARELEARVAEVKAQVEKEAEAKIAAERQAAAKQAEQQVAEARAQAERDAAQRIEAQRAELEKQTAEKVAAERAAAEQAAAAKIAEERTAAEKAAAEKIAAERAAADQAAQQRIAEARTAADQEAAAKIAQERAAAQQAAQQQIAEARAQAEREAAQKIAAERQAIEQQAQQQIAAARQQAERETAEKVAAAEANARRSILEQLRLANADALSGRLADANARYVALLNAPNVPREVVAAAGTGLYRTGDFQDAVRAFQKIGTFAKGEEDLRYYNAVSLFETGRYVEAKKELACALPYIQLTDDVTRYRTKIESMAAQQAMR